MLLQSDIVEWVKQALTEDLGGELDFTQDKTALLIPAESSVRARVMAKEPARICGLAFCQEAFQHVSSAAVFTSSFTDGQDVKAGDIVFTVEGPARALLTAERTALNFLQSLSGTATEVHRLQQKIAHTSTRLLDTRKTIPGLRLPQKYAVTCGGGQNHRIGLYDAFLIKENHIMACGGIEPALRAARRISQTLFLEIEVETLSQLECVIHLLPQYSVQRVMLDNFSLDGLKEAVAYVKGRVPLEMSGNVDESTLVQYAETGVDYISMGALTKNLRAIDFSMRVV